MNVKKSSCVIWHGDKLGTQKRPFAFWSRCWWSVSLHCKVGAVLMVCGATSAFAFDDSERIEKKTCFCCTNFFKHDNRTVDSGRKGKEIAMQSDIYHLTNFTQKCPNKQDHVISYWCCIFKSNRWQTFVHTFSAVNDSKLTCAKLSAKPMGLGHVPKTEANPYQQHSPKIIFQVSVIDADSKPLGSNTSIGIKDLIMKFHGLFVTGFAPNESKFLLKFYNQTIIIFCKINCYLNWCCS